MTSSTKRVREINFVDNLEGLAQIARGSVTLAYLDPPFMSGRSYDMYVGLFRTPKKNGECSAFDDKWAWHETTETMFLALDKLIPQSLAAVIRSLVESLGKTGLTAYLVWLAPRLYLAYETLSKNGSLYLHCDPSSSHYLKILLDKIFGQANFRNEIIWRRTHAHSSSRRYGPVHDVILFYSKTSAYVWNDVRVDYDPSYISNYYTHKDEKGKYQLITCTAPGDRSGTKAHYEWRSKLPPPGRHWAWKREQMEEFEAAGRLVYSSNGIPRLKRYVHDGLGLAVQDVWTDIGRLDAHSAERVGYETQKPVNLLERIITASSQPGDLVLDPFCGSGTTLVAAERLARGWIGMDTSLLACSLSLGRVRARVGAKAVRLTGFPDKSQLALDLMKHAPLEFGIWGASMLATLPERRLTSDTVLIGTGQLGNRKTPLLVSMVPLESKISTQLPPLVIGKTEQIGLLVRVPRTGESLMRWARENFGERIIEVTLQSMTSQDCLNRGIAAEVLRAIA